MTGSEPRRDGPAAWVVGILVVLFALVLMAAVLATGFLVHYNIASNGAGLAAKSVCSAKFVSGRDESAQALMAADVTPASPALAAVSATINEQERSVTASFLGVVSRTASYLPQRGCVLDAPPDPAAQPQVPASRAAAWPAGNAASAPADPQLDAVVEAAFEGAGDPEAANARGVAVVQDGQLLALREAPGFTGAVPLHGWSMTKTVAGMLAYAKLAEAGIGPDTAVVDAFPADREPDWLADWRADDRSTITVADLLYMRSGLDIDEGYNPWDPVVQMLYGEPDMAGWAADHPLESPPGTTWEYLSAVSNILADLVRAQFSTDQEYWDYPNTALFVPVGVGSATLETDTAGTWVASSYLWASTADWARLGQLMLDDGRWDGAAVLPPGWLALAQTPAVPTGEGAGYGAGSWLPANPVGGECRDANLPADTVAMEGHWGQIVAMVPSRDAVIVRLGWTFDRDEFDGCAFLADVLAALPS